METPSNGVTLNAPPDLAEALKQKSAEFVLALLDPNMTAAAVKWQGVMALFAGYDVTQDGNGLRKAVARLQLMMAEK